MASQLPITETSQPDATLVALKQGCRQAFDGIYNQYADKIYWVSRRMYLSDEEAREMVQEVMMTLWEKRTFIDEHLSLNAFLLTITRNKIINQQKKKTKELSRNLSYQSFRDQCHTTTEDHVFYNDLEIQTLKFVDSLPKRKKQIFFLKRKKGMSSKEIAEYLHLSPRTVENNLYQADQEIRKFLRVNQFITQTLLLVISWAII